MKNISRNDFQLRSNVKNFELPQKILKSLISNSLLSTSTRRKLVWQYTRLGTLYSFSFLKNQCMLSGRKRATYSKFNLSRLAIKELFKFSLIPYLQKSSW